MLPGFRFLFAAIMLSVSLLVFGLGAASLFRAAHQAFASNPSWRGAPDVTFAQKGDAPVLATLRVDLPSLDQAQSELAVAPQAAPSAEPPAPTEAEIAPAQIAALGPVGEPAEIADKVSVKAELPTAQNRPPAETAQPAADVTAKSDQTSVAVATSDAPPGGSEPAIAPLEPSPTKADPVPDNSAAASDARKPLVNIATLGGPAVEAVQDNPGNEKAAKADSAKSDQSAIKKRVRARRAAHRRQLAARARLAAQQLLLQQQTDPFTQPFPPLTPVTPPTPPPTKRTPKRDNHVAPVAIGGPPA
jgi:hypothetical protein